MAGDTQRWADLFEAARLLHVHSGDSDDGLTPVRTADLQHLERVLHALDESFRPTRPDAAVEPCPHGPCAWCRAHDARLEDADA